MIQSLPLLTSTFTLLTSFHPSPFNLHSSYFNDWEYRVIAGNKAGEGAPSNTAATAVGRPSPGRFFPGDDSLDSRLENVLNWRPLPRKWGWRPKQEMR